MHHLTAAVEHAEVACQTAGRAVVREHAQQAVEHARALHQQLLAHWLAREPGQPRSSQQVDATRA